MSNYNLSTINNLSNINDALSNITINNSIKIPKSATTTNNINENSNAGILIKDINSNGAGTFYRLHVNSIVNDSPVLYFNNNPILDISNLLAELEAILQYHTLDTSNITLSGGYLNFFNGSIPNTNQGETGVGLRYSSNNTVQFKNYNTGWVDLVDILQHDQFKELKDVDVYTNPLQNNQYITYNANNQKFVNSNLSIKNDSNPTLGGDLNIGDYLLRFSDVYNRFVYNESGIIDNNLLVLKNNTSMTNDYNYIELGNADIVGNPNPYLSAKSTYNLLDVGIDINTLNAGDLNLNAIQSNINANATNLIVSHNLIVNKNMNINGNMNMYGNISVNNLNVTGYSTSSIYRSSNKPGGFLPGSSNHWNIPITAADTFLFNFNDSSAFGTYFANVSAGIDGQKLNLIFNNSSNNIIDVKINFGVDNLLIGSGFANGLIFETSGQSSSLMYLGDGINTWQALNTGATLF